MISANPNGGACLALLSAASFWDEYFVTIVLAGIALVFFLLATLVILRTSRSQESLPSESVQPNPRNSPPAMNQDNRPSPRPVSPANKVAASPATPVPKTTPPETQPVTGPAGEDDTEPDFVKSSKPDVPLPLPSKRDALAAQAAGDWIKAADIWHRLGNLEAEHSALVQLPENGMTHRIADLEFALSRDKDAIPRLGRGLSKSPENERVRLRLVEALLDNGDRKAANELVSVVTQPDSPIKASAEFLSKVARALEATGEIDDAMALLRLAADRQDSRLDVPTRSLFLHQLKRLSMAAPPAYKRTPPSRFFQKALDESEVNMQSGIPPREMVERGSLKPHEVVVGHMALGGVVKEPKWSVRSVASISSRYAFNRLVGERTFSAVFEGVDQLLDCPVAIKLSRISTVEADYEVLRSRLRAIALLNHPNLSKITYVDRYGSVIRAVTEFQSGGTLVTLLQRLERIGLPLVLRILMQITAGIGTAHRHGIIHGDVRPQNIMVGHDNLIKIVDFALEPFPVRSMPPDETPKVGAPLGLTEDEIQSDVGQFGDLIDFVLTNGVVTPTRSGPNGSDPLEELREVANRARANAFSSILYIHRILVQMLDRAMPTSSQSG